VGMDVFVYIHIVFLNLAVVSALSL
jgi:hypothetical protein